MAVKQNVSAPVAAIVIGLVILGTIVYFSRPNAATTPERDVIVLPYEPPLEDSDRKLAHAALAPLGIVSVMPPLAGDRMRGVRVALVLQGLPADRGGIKPGDLIVKFNEWGVSNPMDIGNGVAQADPKKPSKVVVVRAGKELTLVITGLAPPPL